MHPKPMTHPILTLFLALVPLSGNPESGTGPSPVPKTLNEFAALVAFKGPSFSLTSGRGTLVTDGSVESLATSPTRWDLPRTGHFELEAISEMELRWMGKGSMKLEGPAAFDWEGDPFGVSSGVSFRLIQASDIYLEIRRGPMVLGLPGQVELTVASGILQIEKASSGKYSLSSLGGAPLDVAVPTAKGITHVTVRPGRSLWIDPDALNRVAFDRDERIQAELALLAMANAKPQESITPSADVSAQSGLASPPLHMQPKPLAELVSEPIVMATADARVGPAPFIAMGPSHVRPAAIVNVPELVLLPPRTRTQVDSEPFRGFRPIENPWEPGTTYMPEPVSQVHQSPSGLTLSDLLNGHDEPIQVDS